MVTKKARFPGLALSDEDRAELAARERQGDLGMLEARRIQILRLLDQKRTLGDAAKAAGTYPREVRRVGWRYIEGGVKRALSDEPRRRASPMLDGPQKAAIVALACSPAPEGFARWTMRLLAKEVIRRKIVPQISYETVRQALLEQKVKPWREKNVVHPGDRRRVRHENERRT